MCFCSIDEIVKYDELVNGIISGKPNLVAIRSADSVFKLIGIHNEVIGDGAADYETNIEYRICRLYNADRRENAEISEIKRMELSFNYRDYSWKKNGVPSLYHYMKNRCYKAVNVVLDKLELLELPKTSISSIMYLAYRNGDNEFLELCRSRGFTFSERINEHIAKEKQLENVPPISSEGGKYDRGKYLF